MYIYTYDNIILDIVSYNCIFDMVYHTHVSRKEPLAMTVPWPSPRHDKENAEAATF